MISLMRDNLPLLFSRRGMQIALILLLFLPFIFHVGPVKAAPGTDGDLTVNAPNTQLNRYSLVTAIAGNTITINDINDLADGGSGHYANENLTPGDLILIYQAQGATFLDSTDTMTYGAFEYNSAGQYEFGIVESVNGNDITVEDNVLCNGISNVYDVANGRVQVVRVPQYNNLTVNNGGSIITSAWDGTSGGIVSLNVLGTLTVNGSIDTSGSGFRGGNRDNQSLTFFLNNFIYRSTFALDGGEKGESILGFNAEYDANAGRYGRGAPANGGGGGNSHNAGGGGGANGDNNGSWTGAGLPETLNIGWANAWDLDDGTDDGGTPLPVYMIGGSGGGRGGYTYSGNNQNATIIGPNSPFWGGNNRNQVGGLGGRPLDNDPNTRLFFGGGGGAGDNNDGTGSAGANGGGVIIIEASVINGNGEILTNGNDAEDTLFFHSDGTGGGGAGGSIVIQAQSLNGVTLSAAGGDAGSHGLPASPFEDETHGTGGGGGGGFIAVDAPAGTFSNFVDGGANGITASNGLTEFPPNGATLGYSGASISSSFALPGCTAPTSINLSSSSISETENLGNLFMVAFLLLVSITILAMARKDNTRSHS